MRDYPPYINIHTHKIGENEVTISCVGIHPYDSDSGTKLTAEMVDPSIKAIGEIGLDFARDIDRATQEKVFIEQLTIAQELGLPVVIHAVRSTDRVLQILSTFSLRAVIFHGFIGSLQQAKIATERGYYLAFGHRVFNSPKSLDALRNIPITNLFFETDDEQISIEEIYLRGAQYRAESLSEIKEQLYINYKNIFNKQ